MPSARNLFSKGISEKGLRSESRSGSASGVESFNLVQARLEQKNRFEPKVDYNIPSQFARYGSAAQYYEDAVNYILDSYPYDGSLYEKVDWEVSASFLDKFVFEQKYPRATGHVRLGLSYGPQTGETSGYGTFGDNRHITFRSGPHTASVGMIGKPLSETFDLSNKYDTGSNRQGNLEMNFERGVSLEFWLQKTGFVSGSESTKQVIFDLWNSEHVSSASYGRFRVEIHPGVSGEENALYIEASDGSGNGTGPGSVTDLGSSLGITGSLWNHWAVTLQNSGSSLYGQVFKNGSFQATKLLGSAITTPITGAILGAIGALKDSPLPTGAVGPSIGEGVAKLSGSLDELRFWKVKRTNADIGRNWFTQVGGGSNTDLANVDLGLYYKFNEGEFNATASTATDATILDYSGRIGNGYWVNYVTGSRVSASAMVVAGAAEFEFMDPIVHSQHPDILYLRNQLEETGSYWDDINNAGIYASFPQWITDDDQFKGRKVLLQLVQSVASYFDNLHMQLDALPHLKNASYVSASFKPAPFVNRFLEGAGMIAPDIFEEANALESIGNRDDFREYSEKFYDVRNRIYQNIYNNLAYIYKSKGTEKAFRNLIRCFGIGEELIKINLYSDNITFELRDNFKSQVARKKYADFNDVDRFDSTVYQHTSSAVTQSYVASNELMAFKANTYECEVILPQKFGKDSQLYFQTPFITGSLFGAHGAIEGSQAKTWAPTDYASFQVQIIRPEVESNDAYFQLTASNGGVFPTLTSSLFKDVYDNEKWNFAVRIKPDGFPLTPNVTGSDVNDYVVEFLGYNNELDVVKNQFSLTGTIPAASGTAFLQQAKRFFVGAHRTNFTGSTLQLSDAKISSLRVWMSYLEDEVIEAHARDASNHGTLHPYENAYIAELSKSFGDAVEIPQASTLALHWTFENVTASSDSSDSLPTTSDAKFSVLDVSSGSHIRSERHAWLEPIINTVHPGQGDFYLPFSTDVVQREYIHIAKQQLPEVMNSDDLVEIIETGDDLMFTRDSRPANHFYAIEKSMWSIVSEEMLKLFATLKDFNNLIGEPVNRYRLNYKILDHLRGLFFERIGNTPDFEQYIEYFKWIDNSISHMLQQLIPASANFAEDMRTVVESHVLERNKYWNKFPTLEINDSPPEAGAQGIHRLTYSWKEGHAPIPLSQDENALWWKKRAERDLAENSSGVTTVDTARTAILSVRLNALNREFTTPVRLLAATSSVHSASAKPGHVWDEDQVVSIRNLRNDNAPSVISASVKDANGVAVHVPLGNYKHDYEIIQTSGRRINDRYRTKYQYTELDISASAEVEATAMYKLPVRSTGTLNKFIFVERFSAPGGPDVMSRGSLDILSEEVSVYNELNQRNSAVRIPLRLYEQTHAEQFGLHPITSSKGNWHKTNRNTRKQIFESGSGNFVTASKYDNAFVQHAIPQSELQYAWISASIDKDAAQPLGYVSDFMVPNGTSSVTQSGIVFIGASEQSADGINVDFVGLNTLIVEPVDTENNLLSASSYINTRIASISEPNDLNALLLHRNGPYQYSSWKQIQGRYHPVVREHRRNNIVSILDFAEQKEFTTPSGQRLVYNDRRPDRFVNFIESPVSLRSRPMIHVFDITGSRAPVTIRHSYGNNIGGFENQELNNRLGISKCVPQMYDSLLNLYMDSDASLADNPVQGFLKLSYSEFIFPTELNLGKKIVRTRTEYLESSSYSASDVDVWRPHPQTFLGGVFQELSSESVDSTGHNGVDRSPLERRTFWHSNSRIRSRYGLPAPLPDGAFNTKTFLLVSGALTTPIVSSQGIKDGACPSIWPFPCELYHTHSYNVHETPIMSAWSNFDFGELSSLRGFYVSLNGTSDFLGSVATHANHQFWQRAFDSTFGSGSTGTSAPIGGRYFWRYPSSSIGYTELITPGTLLGSYGMESGTNGDDRIHFGDFNHIYRTHIHSGKNPWFDSYEEFYEDIRPHSKDMSVIPEFNISDHMQFYVLDNGGNFRKRNDKLLETVGVETELTFSANAESSSFNEDFFKTYAHSDYMKHFEVIMHDHDRGDLEMSRITLKCQGIKKLRPYNGFYPMTRTPQLAQLFSQSFAPFIGGNHWRRGQTTEDRAPPSGALAMQAANQPFFAPGILHNTIKAGIAMDWPILTGNLEAVAAEGIGASTVTLKEAPNFRIPFEALVGPKEGGVPLSSSAGDKKINWLGPKYLANVFTGSAPFAEHREVFFDWTGEQTSPLYALAMHNFLAETINFFLQDGELETIVSKPANQFKAMVSGNAYYMDVRLNRTNDFKMYGTYFDAINKFRHSASAQTSEFVEPYGDIPTDPVKGTIAMPEEVGIGWAGRYYGPSYDWLDSNKSSLWIAGYNSNWGNGQTHTLQLVYSDPAYAPNLPAYYWGDSIARLKYIADGTEGEASDILTKIFSRIEVQNLNPNLFATMMFHNTSSTEVFRQPAWKGRSTVSSSIDLFGIIKGQRITFDATTKDKRTALATAKGQQAFGAATGEEADATFNRWVIAPRMEVPILNFIDQPEEIYRVITGNGDPGGNPPSDGITGSNWRIPHGMWSGYGKFCTGSCGLFMGLRVSFPDLPAGSGEGTTGLTGSLIDIMGFDTAQQKLGEIADNRIFEEAIVAIPFVDDPTTGDGIAPTTRVLGRNLFAIDRENYEKQRDRIEAGKPAVEPGQEFGNVQFESTSISNLSRQMKKYVMPPELNFDKFDDIDPFIVYFFEFKHTLSKQDLADIWQGVMPRISMNPEKDEVTVTHEMLPWEFFEGKKMPPKVRWLIFKVKKQAAINYFEKTADSRDDNRFKFDFDVGQNVVPEYSYNWPYDYCSLVEVAKMEAQVDIEPRREEQKEPVKTLTPQVLPRTITPVLPTIQTAPVQLNRLPTRLSIPPLPRLSIFGRRF